MKISETSGRVIECRVNHRTVRFFVANANDEVQNHHSHGVFYESEQCEKMANFIDPRKVFLDIGANVGGTTRCMLL